MGVSYSLYLSLPQMMVSVFRSRHQLKVLDPVIEFVSVDVVDDQSLRDRAVCRFPNSAVLLHATAVEQVTKPNATAAANPPLKRCSSRFAVGHLPHVMHVAKTLGVSLASAIGDGTRLIASRDGALRRPQRSFEPQSFVVHRAVASLVGGLFAPHNLTDFHPTIIGAFGEAV